MFVYYLIAFKKYLKKHIRDSFESFGIFCSKFLIKCIMKRKLKKRKGNDGMELIEMQAHEERKCNEVRVYIKEFSKALDRASENINSASRILSEN